MYGVGCVCESVCMVCVCGYVRVCVCERVYIVCVYGVYVYVRVCAYDVCDCM